MIKFFRKIRFQILGTLPESSEQNLLSEGKTSRPAWPVGRYFKYALGEVVLVMIGILLALQVSNWNRNIA